MLIATAFMCREDFCLQYHSLSFRNGEVLSMKGLIL